MISEATKFASLAAFSCYGSASWSPPPGLPSPPATTSSPTSATSSVDPIPWIGFPFGALHCSFFFYLFYVFFFFWCFRGAEYVECDNELPFSGGWCCWSCALPPWKLSWHQVCFLLGLLVVFVGDLGFFVYDVRCICVFGGSVRGEVWGWIFFYMGIAGTAFGSAYYHLKPEDARIPWDQMPVCFSAGFYLKALLFLLMLCKRYFFALIDVQNTHAM